MTCERALFLVKLRKVPDSKTHHISIYKSDVTTYVDP